MNNETKFYASTCHCNYSNWILSVLNIRKENGYLKIKYIYNILQAIIFNQPILYSIVTTTYFWNFYKDETLFYVPVCIPWFQAFIALLLFTKNHKLSSVFRFGAISLLFCHLVIYMICILLWWRQFMLIDFGINVFIWCYGFYYFLHVLSLTIRFMDGRFFILSLLGWKSGYKVIWITDIDIAKQVLLVSSNKGSFIEEKIACPAWSPVLSLESINGDSWIDLKSKFLIFQKYLPSAEQLAHVVRHVLSSQNPNIEIDAKQVVRITLACFVKWIFNQDWDPKWEFVCDASWEWRKEIAAKGKADPLLKRRTIDWLIDLINQSNYYQIFGEQWSTPECYSVIMQPFLLSPMINFSDIAVSASQHPDLSIQELIHYYHPFPIIERYIEKDLVISNDGVNCVLVNANTQVFIPLDTIGQNERYNHKLWTPFGIGPRKCLGSQYAIPFLTEFITHYKNNPKFVPEKNHKYSGRNNDNLSFCESIYQLTLFVKILILD